MLTKVVRAVTQWVPHTSILGSKSITDAPTPQAIVDLFRDWITAFPSSSGVKNSGYVGLFEDGRVPWALDRLGGVQGKDVLELGPLEGAHTYMLDQAGARSITAIEANQRSYLKCLITKEVMEIRNARFLLGDFMPWLEQTNRRFDVIWASGVLYHMTEPLKLLELIASRADSVYLWTHYFTEGRNPYRPPFVGTHTVSFACQEIVHYDRIYLRPQWRPLACGGVRMGSSWLGRNDILYALRSLGFTQIETGFEDTSHPYRSHLAIIARR